MTSKDLLPLFIQKTKRFANVYGRPPGQIAQESVSSNDFVRRSNLVAGQLERIEKMLKKKENSEEEFKELT